MLISNSIGMIVIILPVLLLGVLIAIGTILYRHPSRLQRKWYQVSFHKRKRVKQIAVIAGFVIITAMFIYPQTNGQTMATSVKLSAKEMRFLSNDQLNKKIKDVSGEIKDDKQLRKLYDVIRSDDLFSIQISEDGSSYESWKAGIENDTTGEYEVRLSAEDAATNITDAEVSSEDIDSDVGYDSYNEDGFYSIIKKKDHTFEENYQKLSETKKQKIRNLEWHYKNGVLYAKDKENACINGAAQYFMKDSKLIASLEKAGYHGIKNWMEQCEKDQAGIKVKAGNKTYLFHNTDKWHKFESNGVTFLYNYKRLVVRFDLNKVMEIKSHIADLPQQGRELWTVMSDHTGEGADEIILRSYNEENVYEKKHVQILMKDHKIKQMLIYWSDSESYSVKGFSDQEKIFVKACFEKMGISSEDAQKWLDTFTVAKKNQSGKLGTWTYQQGVSGDQIVSIHDTDNNYVNFYKKSKGNN